jgi:hypothetical protein
MRPQERLMTMTSPQPTIPGAAITNAIDDAEARAAAEIRNDLAAAMRSGMLPVSIRAHVDPRILGGTEAHARQVWLEHLEAAKGRVTLAIEKNLAGADVAPDEGRIDWRLDRDPKREVYLTGVWRPLS